MKIQLEAEYVDQRVIVDITERKYKELVELSYKIARSMPVNFEFASFEDKEIDGARRYDITKMGLIQFVGAYICKEIKIEDIPHLAKVYQSEELYKKWNPDSFYIIGTDMLFLCDHYQVPIEKTLRKLIKDKGVLFNGGGFKMLEKHRKNLRTERVLQINDTIHLLNKRIG